MYLYKNKLMQIIAKQCNYTIKNGLPDFLTALTKLINDTHIVSLSVDN